MLQSILPNCEKCNKPRLWFMVRTRWFNSPIGKVKSELKYCPSCARTAKKLFEQMQVGK